MLPDLEPFEGVPEMVRSWWRQLAPEPAGARGGIGARSDGRGWCERAVPLLLVLLFALASWLSGGTAVASVSDVHPGEGSSRLRELPAWSPPVGRTEVKGRALWFWPEGDRLFQIDGLYRSVESHRLGDLEFVGRSQQLEPKVWQSGNGTTSGDGRHHVAAVDREHGRFFVAYQTEALDQPLVVGGAHSDIAHGETPCGGSEANARCVGGIYVLDGASLETRGKIRLELPTVEGLRVLPVPKALEYVAAVPELGWPGRVLMVVEEVGTGLVENSAAYAVNTAVQNTVPRRNSANISYLVAFDPEAMRQEWVVRLEGCRNAREPRSWPTSPEGHPVAVFRAGGADPAVFVGCHGNAAQQGVVVRVPLDRDGVPATLPARTGDPVREVTSGQGRPGTPVALAPRQEVYPGPEKVTVMMADAVSQRIVMRVDDSGEVWWVFDGSAKQFIGTIGIGGYRHGHTTYGLDPDIGRLYVLAATPSEPWLDERGGLYVADIRRDPLGQALVYPEFADPARYGNPPNTIASSTVGRTMSVQPRAATTATRLFSTVSHQNGNRFRVIVDETPVSTNPLPDTGLVRTLDVAEAPGATEATFDGTARGFGFRAILLGGAEGAARVGPADPVGVVRGIPEFWGGEVGVLADAATAVRTVSPPPDGCSGTQREVVVAFVGPRGPAVVDASSARGEAQPLLADVRTQEDLGKPVTRCSPEDWEALWRRALFARAPVTEPGVDWPFKEGTASCSAIDEEQSSSWSDPVMGAFSSRVECDHQQVGGWGQARGIGLDGVSVADALSSFRIYRDAERGMVARVESIARGVDVAGIVRIDTIRGAAESWANGRSALPEEQDGDQVSAQQDQANPFNCRRERPAGTCFQRHIFGLTVVNPGTGTVGYQCGPCGDEDALVEGINRAFGGYGSIRFRQPDPDLARGSQDGYIAAITKPDKERFSDIVLNADLLETMVPALEIIRYAPHNRPSNDGSIPQYHFGTPPRARQVYQFAAVEVSSTYGIQCLLVYDQESNTCATTPQSPGAITVSLTDTEGKPLAGGTFELREDVDGDAVLGLQDAVVPNGACVTAADGVGTCTFERLRPGSYLVSQVAAPPGYTRIDEPYPVELGPGEQRTVAFSNGTDVATIEVTATDNAGSPLAGATFAVYADDDADGTVAPDMPPTAVCTTGPDGSCTMRVPAGPYVLVQTAAPDGLAPIAPVAFSLSSGGQVAAVEVVNHPPGADGEGGSQQPPVARPVHRGPEANRPTVVETVDAPTTGAGTSGVDRPQVSLPEQVSGTIVRVIRAPADALRLFARQPVEAVAWTIAIVLLVLAMAAVRRHHLLLALTSGPVSPSPGGGTRPVGPPRRGGPAAGWAQSGSSVAFAGVNPVGTATAVLERPTTLAGAAPSRSEVTDANVVLGTASRMIAVLVNGRLADAKHVTLKASVDSLEALRAALAQHDPEVLIVDVRLPLDGGIDLFEILPDLHPPERVVALIPPGTALDVMARRCTAAGVAGVLAVDGDIGDGHLAYTVRHVAAGNRCYGPTVQNVLLGSGGQTASEQGAKVMLSQRELEIALLAAAGLRRAEIAQRLYISDGTVKGHLRTIRSKLGVTNPWNHNELRERLRLRGLLDATAEEAAGSTD